MPDGNERDIKNNTNEQYESRPPHRGRTTSLSPVQNLPIVADYPPRKYSVGFLRYCGIGVEEAEIQNIAKTITRWLSCHIFAGASRP